MQAVGGMPPASTSYTLVGFAAELDWRPVHFVRPIPKNRICSACGTVRSTSALFPCMHVLCRSCYDQSGEEGSHMCPLEGDKCLEEDIDWKEWPSEEVLKREVECWIKGHGCETVVAASLLSQHFQRECRHHSTRCPRCSARVLCSDVCAHLRLDCATAATPFAGDSRHQGCHVEDASLSGSFGRELVQLAGDMRTHLEQLITDVGTQGDRLNEMSHDINICNEALRRELDQTTRQIQESLTTSVDEITRCSDQITKRLTDHNESLSSSLKTLRQNIQDAVLTATRQNLENFAQIMAGIHKLKVESIENSEKTLGRIETLLRRDEPRAEHVEFDVTGIKSLEKAALKTGWVDYEHERIHMCGYRMSPGVCFSKDGESVRLHARLRMHKGDKDDAVQWPFQREIRLSVIHPTAASECLIGFKPRSDTQLFQKPAERTNTVAWFVESSFTLSAITFKGYVFEDKLRIRWEVLP